MTVRHVVYVALFFFFFQAEDGIRDLTVTGVQTCALPISSVTVQTTAPLTGLMFSNVRPWRTNSPPTRRSEEHTSELQSQSNLVCRLLLEKKKACESHHSTCHIRCASRSSPPPSSHGPRPS